MGSEDVGDMDSLYGEGAPAGGSQETTTDQEEAETAEEANTAVVPLKVLQSKEGEPVKEGDEIVVRVVKTYGDECEIMYAPKEKTPESEQSDNAELESLDTY